MEVLNKKANVERKLLRKLVEDALSKISQSSTLYAYDSVFISTKVYNDFFKLT